MEYRVLGSLQLVENGRTLPPERPGPRLLLAALLVHRNEVVTTRRLVDELWPRDPPETATKIVQLYVSQLRKLLGPERLATKGGGYVLHVEPGELDADRFEALVHEARGADPMRARRHLTDALALWHGPAFAEFADQEFARWEAARLDELRWSAEEDRIDCELALGRHALLAAELPRLVREHPLRERLRGQVMLALYRSGRQADALEAYQDVRKKLVEELGLEPSPPLQRLEQAILHHDPELAAPPTIAVEEEQPTARRRLSRPLITAGAVLIAVAVGTTVYEETRGSASGQQALIPVRPNSLAVLDPHSGRVGADIGVGSRPSRVAAEGGDVWVLNADDRTVSRVDASTQQVRTVSVGGTPADLAVGGGAVWVVQSAARVSVYRIDPVTTATERIVLPGRFPYGGYDYGSAYIAYGAGAVWVSRAANGGGVLWRIEPGSGVVRRIALPAGGGPVAVGAGAVWVTGSFAPALTRVDPKTLSVHSIREIRFDVPSGPTVGAGQLWVPDLANVHNEYSADVGTLWDVDPATGNVTRTVVGGGASAAVVHSGAVWVACSLSGTVVRVDPSREAVVQTIPLGGSPSGLAFSKNKLWVSVS